MEMAFDSVAKQNIMIMIYDFYIGIIASQFHEFFYLPISNFYTIHR